MTRSAPAAIAVRDRTFGPIAAADLEREPARRRDALDETERRHAAERAVEIDEVEPPCSLVAEPPRELDRVAALDRYRLATPLVEADDAPFEHVDCRQYIEVLC